MRTLLFLLPCLFFYYCTSAQENSSHVYIAPGAGRLDANHDYTISGNIGMKISEDWKNFYLQAGVGVYYLRTSEQSTYNYYAGYQAARQNDFAPELPIGLGYRLSVNKTVIRLGVDGGYMLSLQNYGHNFDIIPQLAIMGKTKGNAAVGLLLKAALPVDGSATYNPSFIGGGLIVQF